MASYSPARRRSYSTISASSSITMTPPPPPFPWRQLLVLACCRICEPIAFMSIFPYIYYMIKSFNIASTDKEIAIYAGMVTSAFAFAEFSCSIPWGKLSDRIGRKPVLLTGLAGTGLSMVVFGFAQNLTVALIARALGGFLNGNMGVLQTTVAEVVKNPGHSKSQKARAFALMPFVWCLGSIVGSGLGGLLAEPVKNFPGTFARDGLFDHFPFLLPNLISTGVVLFSLVIGFLFLEETHEQKKDRRDAGLELGQWISDVFRARSSQPTGYSKLAEAHLDETTYLTHDVNLADPEYRSDDENSEATIVEHDPEAASKTPALGTGKVFTTQVVLNIVAFGILAYHTITLEQLLPVMLSMDDTQAPPSSIIKFIGGFGLPSSTIGYIFMAQGIYQMFAQLVVFPAVSNRFGALATFRFTALTYPLLYLVIPYLTWLSGPLRFGALFLILVWKTTHQSLSYPSNALLLNDESPSPLVLGVINGFAASAASLSRAVGPTVSGLIQAAGLNAGYLVIPWWTSGAVAVVGAALSLCLRAKHAVNAPAAGLRVENEARGDAQPEFRRRRLSDVSDASTVAAEESDETGGGEVRQQRPAWGRERMATA